MKHHKKVLNQPSAETGCSDDCPCGKKAGPSGLCDDCFLNRKGGSLMQPIDVPSKVWLESRDGNRYYQCPNCFGRNIGISDVGSIHQKPGWIWQCQSCGFMKKSTVLSQPPKYETCRTQANMKEPQTTTSANDAKKVA